MSMRHVVVVSIGNPGAYLNTRHSVGHLAIEVVRRQLGLPAFAVQRRYGKGALVSQGVSPTTGMRYTLAQSPAYMNVSGPWVKQVYGLVLDDVKAGLKEDSALAGHALVQAAKSDIGLLVLHDDLEEDPGTVKARPLSRSARGHNGLRSIKDSMRPVEWAGAPWAALAIGIGRPDDADVYAKGKNKGARLDVADWVLAPIPMAQRSDFEASVERKGMEILRGVESAWASGSLLPGQQKTPVPKRERSRPSKKAPSDKHEPVKPETPQA